MERKNIIVYTDGSCIGNGAANNKGGWAAIMQYGEKTKEIFGSALNTTNNRMELQAVIEAVKVLKVPCVITIRTDSKYVITASQNAPMWEKCNWTIASGKAPKNLDLIQELTRVGAKGRHKFQFQYVEGHAGDKLNERADKLARKAAKEAANE